MEIYRRFKSRAGEDAGVFKLVKNKNNYYWRYDSQKTFDVYPIIIVDCHHLALNVDFDESHI